MRLKFTKMHGLGNDFVVLEALARPLALTPDQLRRIADRLDAADEFGAAMEAYMRDESTLSWNLDGWWGTPVDSSAVVGPCPSKKEAILAIYRWQMRDDARHHHGPDNR